MKRYQAYKAKSFGDLKSIWLVLDRKTNVVVKFNGVPLNMLTESQAQSFVHLFNQIDIEAANFETKAVTGIA